MINEQNINIPKLKKKNYHVFKIFRVQISEDPLMTINVELSIRHCALGPNMALMTIRNEKILHSVELYNAILLNFFLCIFQLHRWCNG
jgi:hypothetical protein